MTSVNEEWDWPPRRHRSAPTIEGRITSERVILTKPGRRSSAAQTWPNRAADIFFNVVWTGTKLVIATGLTLLILACVWFIGALLRVG